MRSFLAACLLLSLAFVAGCSGTSPQAALPLPQMDSARTALKAGATHDTSRDPKRPHHVLRPGAGGTKVFIYGYLYPSYAGTGYAYWTGPVTVGKGGTITVPFGKVTPANNEWMVVDVYANDGVYGGAYLGNEAGVFNVGKGAATLTVSPASTLQFQALMAMDDIGVLTATDLKNPKLMKTVNALVKSSGITADPKTGLYSNASLTTFAAKVQPLWQRTMTIVGGTSAAMISVSNGTADKANMNAADNRETFLNDDISGFTQPAGVPCYDSEDQGVGKHAPLTGYSCSHLYGTGTGTVTVPVFGGSLVVGATNGVSPFTGATMTTNGGAPGAKTTVTLTQIPTEVDLASTDPQDWAFNRRPNAPLSIVAPGGVPDYLQETGLFDEPFSSYDEHVQITVPSAYSAGSPDIAINTWNPWGQPLTNFRLCSYSLQQCTQSPLTAGLAFVQPFIDYGTSATYWNWQGQSGTGITYDSTCHGYQLTPSGSTITIKTTVPAYFTVGENLGAGFSTCGGGGTPASGTQLLVTATDAAGDVFSGAGNTNTGYGLQMNTISFMQATSVTVTITLGSGSPSQIFLYHL